jgi:hypothetical protein
MTIDTLIARLAAEAGPVRPHRVTAAMAVALAIGLSVAALLFALTFGPRNDLAAALVLPLVAAKTLLPLALGLMALALARTAVHPAARPGPAARAIWLVPGLALAMFLWALALPPDVGRQMAFTGKSLAYCLPAIVGLSLPVTAALLLALRRGAPVRPAWAGALAGLASGGLAATIYSLYCTEDTPLFYAVWYSVGIGIAAALGALAGSRALRW